MARCKQTKQQGSRWSRRSTKREKESCAGCAADGTAVLGQGGGNRNFNRLQKFNNIRAEWKEWAPVFMIYISSISMALKEAMPDCHTCPDPQFNEMMDSQPEPLIVNLHFMFVQLTSGTALDIIPNAGDGEGLESWRRLLAEFDPTAPSSSAGSMMELLSHLFTDDTSTFEQFEKNVWHISVAQERCWMMDWPAGWS